jgi:hypothetical protein
MSTMRVSRAWILTTVGYAAVIAALTWSWAGNPGGFNLAEAATFVLLLPTSLLTLPVTYLALSLIWNVTGSSVAQDHVPTIVTAVYSLWFALLAVVNAAVVTIGYRVLRPRQTNAPETLPVSPR